MHLSIVWHFHQPIYQRPGSREYVLPWVNFHATKNYHPMGELVGETRLPLHLQFRPLPSRTAPGICPGHWPSTPFRGPSRRTRRPDLRRRASCAVSPRRRGRRRRPEAGPRALFSPARSAARADRDALLARRKELHADLFPLFRDLRRQGLAEITTSPYYHPLLPLVFDVLIARPRRPRRSRFRHPEDGRTQLRMGCDYFQEVFGFAPDGLWPSEGRGQPRGRPGGRRAAGFAFAVTDENVLWKSLGRARTTGRPFTGPTRPRACRSSSGTASFPT